MPETTAAWIAANTLTATSVLTYTQITALTYAAFTAASLGYGDYQRRKNQRKARDAFNASVSDRLVMTATAQAARSRVYGRVRNVDGVVFKQTHGTNNQFYTLVIALAGHQVDAIEQVWFNDKPVTLDGAGNVTSGDTAITTRETPSTLATTIGPGGGWVVTGSPILSIPPIATITTGSDESQVTQSQAGSWNGSGEAVFAVDVAGWSIIYQTDLVATKARVRLYTGAPGQNLYTDLQALVDSVVQPSDRFEGFAALLVTLQYDQDAYPTGVPSFSAVLRGARVFDPRTGTTAWTENPALIARDWSLYAYGGGCVTGELNEPSFTAAANACDVSTSFGLPVGGPVVLPLYQCGIVIPLDSNPDDALSEICEAMAGQWGWAGGRLSVRAGVYRAPVATITEDWLSGVEVIQITPSVGQAEALNIIRPSYADAAQGWVQTPGPEVRPAEYVTADGRELPLEIELGGVTRAVHAQHVSAVILREAREGLTVELPCNLRAYQLELFDVVAVTLARFGWAGKLFEVVGWRFTLAGAVMLRLRETAAAIYTPDAVFDLINTSPNTGLPRPTRPAALTGLAATSGGVAQIDGSSLARIRVTWAPVAEEAVRQSGSIEVQVAEAYPALPAGDWPTLAPVAGRATGADIFGQRIGRLVVIRARAVNTLGMAGPWRSLTHTVSGRRAPVVWRQALAPSGASVQNGDEWVDTDDGNRRYVREGGVWVDVRDAGIAAALATAEAAQATADGKIDTFWQATAPAVASEGDIWFDTDDGNRQYRRTGGAWVVAADTRIGTAISNAATAQATADGRVRTYVQTTPPAASAAGDLWLDSDDGFRMYRWSGSAWVDVRDAGISAALATAEAAQATADGKIDTFWQATAPAVASEGDIWFDTDDGNRQYRRTSGVWVVAADTRIGTAVAAAADAQATADGKVTTFVGGTAPTAEGVGDLWLDTANGNRLNRWSGSAWVAVPIGTGGLAANATTDTVVDLQTFWGVAVGPSGGTDERDICTASYTNTTGGAINVQMEVGYTETLVSWSGSRPVDNWTRMVWSSATLSGSINLRTAWPDSSVSSLGMSDTAVWQVSLPAGQTLTVKMRARIAHTAAAGLSGDSAFVRVTAIKR